MPLPFGLEQGGINLKFNIPKNEPKNEQNPTTWLKWYDGLDETNPFTYQPSKVVFKEAPNPVFFLFNEEDNTGVSLYCEHSPNAKFTDSTPDGIRFVNAVARAFKLKGDVDSDAIVDALNGSSATITCAKTEKGRLWSVQV